MTRFENQDAIARRQRVDECRLGRPRPGRRKDDHGTGSLEDALQPLQNFGRQRGEFRAAVVDDRLIHGPKDAIWNIGRAGDLQKVTACVIHDPESLL